MRIRNRYLFGSLQSIYHKILEVIFSYEPKKSDIFLYFFLAAFISANFVTNVMAPRIIKVNFLDIDLIAGGGIFAYTLSIYILDTVTEFYKINKSIIFIFANIFALTLAELVFKFIMQVPSTELIGKNIHYEMVIGYFCSTYIPTMFASILGYLFNCFLLDWFRPKIKSFYSRLFIITIFAELVYSFVWYAFYLKGRIDFTVMLNIIGANFFIKIAAQCVFLPVTKLTVNFLKIYDNFIIIQKKFN